MTKFEMCRKLFNVFTFHSEFFFETCTDGIYLMSLEDADVIDTGAVQIRYLSVEELLLAG